MKARAETVRAEGMAAGVQSTLERHFTLSCGNMGFNLNAEHPYETLRDSLPHIGLCRRARPKHAPSVARELCEAIPGATITVISDASHIVTVEAFAAANHALEAFLNPLKD